MIKVCALAALAATLPGCVRPAASWKGEVKWPETEQDEQSVKTIVPVTEAEAALAAAAAIREMVSANPFPRLFQGCSSPAQGMDVAVFTGPTPGLYYVVLGQRFDRCGGPQRTSSRLELCVRSHPPGRGGREGPTTTRRTACDFPSPHEPSFARTNTSPCRSTAGGWHRNAPVGTTTGLLSSARACPSACGCSFPSVTVTSPSATRYVRVNAHAHSHSEKVGACEPLAPGGGWSTWRCCRRCSPNCSRCCCSSSW